MKKIYLMTAMAIAMTFTACSSSEDGVEVDNPKTPVLAQKVPVGFNAYANRGLTRSGVAGDLNLTALEAPAGVDPADGGGFGVFAYYTDLKKYDQTYIPNFMYNQGVFKNGANWEYTPVMYWPNESGSDAQSDDEDKVSFFAYAPYVKHTSAASGSVADATYGITGFSRNSTAGDPIVKYIASFDPAKSVDLCWGVCAGTSWAKFQGAGNQTMQEGLPWLDVEHPQGIDQKMTFTFRHALAQLNVQIDADPDIATHNETSEVATGTKVYVRSISFTGIATHGALNLNNTEKDKPLWLDYSGTTDLPYGESVTVKDGRRDGREGATGAEATNETPAGLNPQIVQNNPATTGVTKSLQNLFNGADVTTPVYVIPTGEKMTVSIVYDVETVNPNLSGYTSDGVTHGVSVENKITKDITWSAGTGLEAGKKYTLQLHLGLNSVKFDADVAAWDDSAVNGSGWLPSNTPVISLQTSNSSNNGYVTFGSIPTQQWTGSAVEPAAPTITVKVNGGTNTLSASDYDISYSNNTDEGSSAVMTITGKGNYTGSVSTNFTITKDPGVSLASATVGMVIGADGKAYSTIAQANTYSTAAAIIAYKGNGEANSSYNTGLAISLADVSGTKKWKSSADGTCTAQNSTIATILSDLQGLTHTATLCSAGHTSHDHQAATAADGYTSTMATPTGCSKWFLPTIGQWNLIVKAMCGGSTDLTTSTNNSYKAAEFNKKIRVAYGVSESTACAGDVLQATYYWSSVEYNTYNAWLMYFGDGDALRGNKIGDLYVRPVLAF